MIGATPLGERLDKLKMLVRYYMVKLKEKNQASLVLLRSYTDKLIQARLAPQSDKPTPSKDLRALKEVKRIRIKQELCCTIIFFRDIHYALQQYQL